MPEPSLDTLIDQYPPDARDDLRSIADRMEFQLNNFCQVAGMLPLLFYRAQLHQLLNHILDRRNNNPTLE